MGLLDFGEKFNEPVFYKTGSELEIQIEALKRIRAEYPENEKIATKLKLAELGLKGEKEIEYELKNSNIGMYILHDINIKHEDLTAQIDYIIMTPVYIYFIESKNLIGNITINENGDFIREYTLNGEKIREGIYSPIRQAERHRELFKKLWRNRLNKSYIYRWTGDNFMDKMLKTIVVLSNPKSILDLSKAPDNVKGKIIKSDQLVEYIKNDLKTSNKDFWSTKKELEEYAYYWIRNYNSVTCRNYIQEYRELAEKTQGEPIETDNKQQEIMNKLREELISFRTSRSKEKNVPAYYVFNNEELEKILERKPKTVEELKNEQIIAKIKAITHGKEIIEIINKYVAF